MTALPGQGPSDAQAPADARPAADDPVTVLYSRRVKPGREADFETWARGIVAAARRFPGHLGASVLDAPGSREYHILFTFADAGACGPGSTPTSVAAGWPG
jgi:antibiotic biosynthesis monooxygenase (ABM) superfamily enzyme